MRGEARLKAAFGLLWLLSLALCTETTPLNRENRMVRSDGSSEESQEGSGLDQIISYRQPTNESQNGCTVGDILYQYGETIPGSDPCEKCVCGRSGISCSSVQCQVKAGCKALHRADHCCPLYQCECERNGTIYSNGEKLIDPNPCQVCYCQGGEIVCNQIACFRRHDCEPLYVSGRCCPEYDHCPPSDKDIENHIPQSDSSSSSSDKGKLSNKESDLTEKESNKPAVSNVNELSDNSKSSGKSKPEKSQTINIKEVTGMKPSNEIRIKEILPASSYDASLTSTKSPTIPREVDKFVLEDLIKTDSVTSHPEDDQEYQTPPVLRIGDQLLFLNVGDLVPENSAVNTPSSVFTVIGAEGLQRGDEDQEEETLEERKDTLNETSFDDIYVFGNETIFKKENETDDMLTDEERNPISDVYGIPINSTEINTDYESNNTDTITNIDDNPSSTENIYEKEAIPEIIIDEETQPIPIEHLPEHNPEYPPIPEDIMILSMTEEPVEMGLSEVDFSGVNPILDDGKDEQKIKIVKRPVMPLPPVVKSNKNKVNEKESKIIQEVLQTVKNETNTNSTVPDSWLKGTSTPETLSTKLNSPLINLESALPDSILNEDDEKTESSEEDTKEYIFITNDTIKDSQNEEIVVTPTALEPINNEDLTTDNYTPSSFSDNLESIADNYTAEPDTIYSEVTDDDNSTLDKIEILNEYATVDNVQEFTDDTITNLIVSTEKTTVDLAHVSSTLETNVDSPNKEIEVIEKYHPLTNPEFFDTPSIKQKKAPASASEKKHDNILADLINLVGDVAAIGTHDVEVSSVHNHLEFEKYTNSPSKPHTEEPYAILHISTAVPDSLSSASEVIVNHTNVELTEYHPGDVVTHETTTEHEKIEFTTKKMLIDKDSDERNKWKSTDHIDHEIEIIPKVENSPTNKKNKSLEKIIKQSENSSNVIVNEKPSTKAVKPSTPIPDIPITTKKVPAVNATPKKPPKVTPSTTPKPATPKAKSNATTTTKKNKVAATTKPSVPKPKATTTTTQSLEAETSVPSTTVKVKPTSTPKIKVKPTKLSVTTATKPSTTTTTTTTTTASPSPEPSTSTTTTTTAAPLIVEDDISSPDEESAEEKPAKRETDELEIGGLGEQKEMSLVSILKDFFEKQYRQ